MKLAKKISLGEIQGEDWLLLPLELLLRHVFLAGGTGGGKTMWVMGLIRQLIDHMIGFTFISPHTDGREKILHHCMLNNVDPARIVDVFPGTDCCPSLDPFAHMPEGLNRLREETWLQSECKRIISAMLSNVPLADQEVMNQLNTWLMNSLYMCGKRVDGEYLGLQKSLMLFDVDHPEHDFTMNRLLPVVPDYMAFDWRMYRETKNVNQRRVMVQSTINRLRRVIYPNPVVTQMFAKGNAVNDEEIIIGNKIQIISVPDCDDLPREAGNVIARMRISSMISAVKRLAERTPEHLRPYHFLIIDEAENFIGEDLRTAFQELRKFHMPIIIIVQDLSCLMKGDMDLVPKVVSQCNVHLTGNQQDRDSLDYLADTFSAPFVNLTPLRSLQAIPVGHEIIQTQSVSFNSSQGISVGEADAMTQTRSVTKQRGVGQSVQQSVALALSSTHSEGTTEGVSHGGSKGVAEGSNWSKRTGTSETLTESQSRQRSRTSSVGETESMTESESDAVSRQEAKNFSTSKSTQLSTSDSAGTTETTSKGEADGTSEGRGRSGPLNTFHPTLSANTGKSSSKTSSEANGRSSSHTSGMSEGESATEGGSESSGETHTKSRGASKGTTRTNGETEGEGETRGRSVGRQESDGVGGSLTKSEQESWTANKGRSSTDANGVTRTVGGSAGSSTSESEGVSDGRSTGHTDSRSESQSNGVAVSFNQVPLPLTEFITPLTGRLVVSVPDQIAAFKQCIASLPDRMMLVKVRGMDRPFLLKTHFVADPYDQKKLFVCDAWRAVKLKQYVAKIRKAHPWYFLPSLDEDEPVAAPKPKPRKKHPELEESPLL